MAKKKQTSKGKKRGTGKKKSAKKKSAQPPASTAPNDPPPSMDFMEALLESLEGPDPGPRTPVDEAQKIMYDAWEAPSRKQAVALAKKALTVSHDCADAYTLLAEETAKTLDEAIEMYREGVAAGERALGRQVFKEDVGYFWGLLETRPYMRARCGLAQSLWEGGQREEAIAHYWELLRLNPNDNQGVRDLLMPCLIELGRDKDAEKLFKQYKDDCMAVWMYSRALLDFRTSGDCPKSKKSLQEALKENPHVPSYLLGRKKLPRALPGYYGFGDANEAVLYAYGNKAAWEVTPGASEWLAANVKKGGH